MTNAAAAAATDDHAEIAASVPAVIRGAEEHRYVRRRCMEAATRQTAAVGLLILPSIAALAVALASAGAGQYLAVWIMAALFAQLLVLGALYLVREAQASGDPEDSSPWVHVAFGTVAAVWGATTLVLDWSEGSDRAQSTAFVMFPFMIAVLLLVQTAPLRSLFRATQIPMVATIAIGLVIAQRSYTIALAVCAVIWYGIAEVLHRSLNRSAVEVHQMRWRADELVDHLRAERQRLAEANSRLAEQAVRDPLTGLLNRRGSIEALDAALAAAPVGGESAVGVLFVDIDMFKSVNDTLGHRAGDELLQAMAQRMMDTLASSGAACGRLGGDELVAIVPGSGDLDDLVRLAGLLRVAMSEPFALLGRERHVSVSIGVARAPDHGTAPTDILRSANEALHQAKSRGRNRVVAFDPTLREDSDRRAMAEQAVRAAADSQEIVAWFQPEFDALSGRLVGAELMPRWVRPDGSVVTGIDLQSTHLDAHTLERVHEVLVRSGTAAIADLAHDQLPSGFRFRIALASRGASRTWRADHLRSLVGGSSPALLTVSVTEPSIRRDLAGAAAALAALRAAGIRVALDDVAAHTASLSVLRTVPLDEVRIDRSSLDSVETRPQDRAVVRAIVGLARELGLGVAAVNVDTGTQADALLALGCVRHQGVLYAPPMPVESFAMLLAETADAASRAASPSRSPFPPPTPASRRVPDMPNMLR